MHVVEIIWANAHTEASIHSIMLACLTIFSQHGQFPDT